MSMTDTQSRAGMIRTMFAASDSGNIDGMLSFLTDDVLLFFGNGGAVRGKAAVKAQARQVTSRLKGVRHEIHGIWQVGDNADVVIAQMTVHYTRLDASTVSLPCCNIFRLSGDLIADYRIYMDISPVFA
jgi:ketosteroid isomerase-like protein